jgi:hypothetical protein
MDRYDVLGSLLALETAVEAGERVGVEEVAALLPRLRAVGRPEAWRVAARFGHVLRSDELLRWSGQRVDELVRRSGPYAGHVRQQAAAVLSLDR